MARSVVIAAIGKKHCGVPVYRPGMEVWGINDCYQHCPEIKRFYKIYNIHKAFPECTEKMEGRYKDWRNRYNASKALIITAKDLGLKKQRILDITKLREENPDYVFCSSVSYAIFEAVKAGYTEIRLYRVSLNAGEYKHQGRGIISNIIWAQKQGVKVYWPWYHSELKTETNVFYGEMSDINMQYGELNDVPPAKVTPAMLDIKGIKAEIKAKGGKLPKGRASKDKLLEVLNGLL